MADLESRLACGCVLRYAPTLPHGGGMAHDCEQWEQCSAVQAQLHPSFAEVLSVGYAIAASRGLGPWAERWPG